MNTRYEWLDVAKVLGIYLMILGHQNLVSQQVGQWIYSFHMPLFFFCQVSVSPKDLSLTN